MLVLISLLLSLNAYMLELDGKDVLNECLPLAEIQILCVKSLVFYASIDVKFYDFYTCRYAFFVILQEILSLIAV